MVKTMETNNGQMSGFEMPYDNPNDLESDFSVISHPTTDSPPNVNLDQLQHLNHLNFSGMDLEGPQSSQEQVQGEMSISNSLIQQHLEQILKENMELKEALQQNNATLRQHFQTLISWQEQQTKVRQRHKQMIEDLQEASQSLQREKESLLSKGEDLSTLLAENCDEINKQREALNAKDIQIGELVTQVERHDVMYMQLEQQFKEVQADCEQLKLQNQSLKVQKDTNLKQLQESPVLVDDDLGYTVVHHSGFNAENSKLEIERLEVTVESLLENKTLLMTLLSEKELELKELQEKLEATLSELGTLKQCQEVSLSQMSSVTSPPDQKWVMMETGIINSTSDLEAAASCLQKYGNRFSSIDEQLGECQRRLCESIKTENHSNVDELHREIETLRDLLKEEEQNKYTDRKSLEESQYKFEALHKEYKSLMKQWHDYQSEMQTKSRQIEAMSQIEKRQNQEQLDEVTAKVMMQEEIIHEKDRDLLQIKNRVDILMRETEQIPILRAQAELFQQKLKKKEEEAKKIESVIESQKRDIHSLQAQVVQLMDEINHHNQKQVVQLSGQAQLRNSAVYDRRGSHSRGTVSAPHSRRQSAERHVVPISVRPLDEQTEENHEEQSKNVECPKCRLKFSSLQAAENHVEVCCFGPDNSSNPFL